MSTLRNRVLLIGNLGQDPEIKSFENEKKLAIINVATNEVYKNAQGEKIESVQWHRCTAWGKLAEILEQYAKKGQEVAVGGKLITRTFENSKGESVSRTEVQINELQMLGARREEAA